MTTRTVRKDMVVRDAVLHFIPASEYCYTIGDNAVQSRKRLGHHNNTHDE